MARFCRTCLELIVPGEQFYNLDGQLTDESEQIKSHLESIVPQMTLNIVQGPVICIYCVESLTTATNFKLKCIQTEEKIYNHILETEGPSHCIDISLVSCKDINTAGNVKNKEIVCEVEVFEEKLISIDFPEQFPLIKSDNENNWDNTLCFKIEQVDPSNVVANNYLDHNTSSKKSAEDSITEQFHRIEKNSQLPASVLYTSTEHFHGPDETEIRSNAALPNELDKQPPGDEESEAITIAPCSEVLPLAEDVFRGSLEQNSKLLTTLQENSNRNGNLDKIQTLNKKRRKRKRRVKTISRRRRFSLKSHRNKIQVNNKTRLQEVDEEQKQCDEIIKIKSRKLQKLHNKQTVSEEFQKITAKNSNQYEKHQNCNTPVQLDKTNDSSCRFKKYKKTSNASKQHTGQNTTYDAYESKTDRIRTACAIPILHEAEDNSDKPKNQTEWCEFQQTPNKKINCNQTVHRAVINSHKLKRTSMSSSMKLLKKSKYITYLNNLFELEIAHINNTKNNEDASKNKIELNTVISKCNGDVPQNKTELKVASIVKYNGDTSENKTEANISSMKNNEDSSKNKSELNISSRKNNKAVIKSKTELKVSSLKNNEDASKKKTELNISSLKNNEDVNKSKTELKAKNIYLRNQKRHLRRRL